MTMTLFDPDLSRGRDNPQSQAAHEAVLPTKASNRQRCFDLIHSQGGYGATLAELCTRMGKLPHQLSGRISELKAEGSISATRRVRAEHTVYVISEYRDNQ